MCLGVPGRIKELLSGNKAKADVAGNEVEISVRLTPDVKKGDYVLIHAGFAMEVIDETFARETMEVLEELEQYGR